MPETPNVVKPGESPTPPASQPLPAGSSAAPAPSKPEDVKKAPPAPALEDAAKKAEIDANLQKALHEERGKRQQRDAQVAQLQALFPDKFKIDDLGNITPIAPQVPTGVNIQQEEFQKKMDKLWEEDPRKAVEAQTNATVLMAIDWYDRLYNKIGDEKEVLKGKYKDFGTYESEVDKYIKKLPLGDRDKTGVAEWAYLVIRGQKLDPAASQQAAIDDLIRRIQAGEQIQGLSGGTYSAPASTGGPTATTEQAAAAAAMNMSVEDYMKFVK